MKSVLIEFARLWGQHEAYVYSTKDEEISDMLKGYDSVDMLHLLEAWVYEFLSGKYNIDEFFEQKIEEMYKEAI